MAGTRISLYLDENISFPIADWLRRSGQDVIHAFDENRMHVSDEEHLRYASSLGRALVTHNFADFVRIHAEFLRRGEPHLGIVLMPVRPDSVVVARLSSHVARFTPAEQAGQILWA
jgi:predicted nuclease of predicted toxin-antitoxin system